MNWISEGHLSWSNLQWMRQVTAEDNHPATCLPHLIRGLDQWDANIERGRHSVGDPDRISSNEYFLYAASMLSRAAKEAIEGALKSAMLWEVDNPMVWHQDGFDLDEANGYWAASHYVITNVLAAWIDLWNDLVPFQDSLSASSQEELLEQWQGLATQAADTLSGLAVAFWAGSGHAAAA